MNPITSKSALIELLKDNKPHEFRLLLNGGAFSRKTIKRISKDLYKTTNHIDDSIQRLTEKELFDPEITNILEGIEKNSFIHEHQY